MVFRLVIRSDPQAVRDHNHNPWNGSLILDLVDTQNCQEDTMNKADLINALKDETELTKPEAVAVVTPYACLRE